MGGNDIGINALGTIPSTTNFHCCLRYFKPIFTRSDLVLLFTVVQSLSHENPYFLSYSASPSPLKFVHRHQTYFHSSLLHHLTNLYLSIDPALRRRALATISTHLTTRTMPLTLTQALQLQKGFFFALYMHDSKSPISVQNLIATLANLTVSTATPASPAAVALPLTEAFWTTMAREWTSIDAHRMDKYLLFVRFIVRRVLAGMVQGATNKEDTEEEVQKRQIALLEDFPLSPRERKVPDGLRYHVLDIYVDELERAIALGEDGGNEEEKEEEQGEEEISEETRTQVERLLVPVETVAKEGLSKGVRVRAKEVLADERVVRWRTKGKGESRSSADGGEGGEQDAEWGGLG
jgi:ribosomal RNA-processing protein 1